MAKMFERQLSRAVEVEGMGAKRKGSVQEAEGTGRGADGGGVDGLGAKRLKREKEGRQEAVSKYFMPSPASPEAGAKAKSETETPTTGPTTRPEARSKMPATALTTAPAVKPEARFINASTQPQTASDLDTLRLQISTHPSLTMFRKQALALLLSVPRGRWTTYAALTEHISRTSHKTCARAVGSAIRNNPFAPDVPCHRVLAAGGALGGFGGEWGEGGKYAGEKRRLLGEEGVWFDGKGKAMGRAFDFEEW